MNRSPTEYVADLMTLANGVFGFLAVLTLSVELGALEHYEDTYVAAFYIGLGLVMDGLDGIVARRWGSTGLGDSLDTICDAITFSLAPGVLLLHIQGPQAPLAASLVATALLVLGMLRLARNRERGRDDTFDGLPTPWSGAAVTIVVLLQAAYGFHVWIVLAATALLAVLNITHIQYPKTKGPALTRMALLVLAACAAVVAALVLAPQLAPAVLIAAAAVAAAMVLLSPWLARLLGGGDDV